MAEEREKPVFDEQPLAKLLEAAYVLQEHNRELKKLELNLELQREQIKAQGQTSFVPSSNPSQAPVPKDDYTLTLAQIVETQHQIQARHLDLDDAMTLVAERVAEIANAGGASIGILEGKKVVYRAAAGSMTLPTGTGVPMENALCVASLRTGQVIRCADVNSEFLVDVEACQRRGIQSLIAVPVYHEDSTAGGLELYYGTRQAFTEQDVHTCQLMAGLVTEALARNKELAAKKSLADERALMLEALERLKPNLTAFMENSAPKTPAGISAAPSATSAFVCRKCGNRLMGEEQFCGRCGTPRSSDYESPSMQSKVASLWQMQEARRKSSAGETANGASAPDQAEAEETAQEEKPLAGSMEEEMPELFAPPELRTLEAGEGEEAHQPFSLEFEGELGQQDSSPILTATGDTLAADTNSSPATALAKADHPWNSATTARAFLEQLGGVHRNGGLRGFWETRRGDIYLAVAVILILIVLAGIWTSRPVSATNGRNPAAATHRKIDPAADLSFFDRMLISLGLAEAPPTPESRGNPDTQVWVDLQTALYYCPGTDLYGKTPKGKFTSQRDAQLDQFEPAYRKSCD